MLGRRRVVSSRGYTVWWHAGCRPNHPRWNAVAVMGRIMVMVLIRHSRSHRVAVLIVLGCLHWWPLRVAATIIVAPGEVRLIATVPAAATTTWTTSVVTSAAAVALIMSVVSR